jgi:hypothetical protein
MLLLNISSQSDVEKERAEDGELHKTAYRLGFLFRELVPETPNLRASKVMKSPVFNPRGTADDDLFCDYIGADGTCIGTATSIYIGLVQHVFARLHAGPRLGCKRGDQYMGRACPRASFTN